ncbi:DUF185-domain-containing protein [Xylariaceae sp. FL0804]|nr:DUF185-domain-containing protein [Xylariaceae sp. FL0804]
MRSGLLRVTGPVPLASYMRMCLTGDIGGYYTGASEEGRDQFGRRGDFITSPEISQVFGELIGIWFVAEWMSQGRPRQGVDLIEVGPGRGTLMDDMLRTISQFKDLASSIDAVYLVEASGELREAQKNLLCGADAPLRESKAGWHCTSKYGGVPVVWADTIKAVPHDPTKTPFIVAHEFFDALPIHAFQVVEVPPPPAPADPPAQEETADAARVTVTPRAASSSSSSSSSPTRQWREMVVSPTPLGTTHADLGTPRSQQHEPVPEFQLTVSPSATRHSRYLPHTSPRYRALGHQPGATIEVCPDASLYVSDFASRIGGTPAQPRGSVAAAAAAASFSTSSSTSSSASSSASASSPAPPPAGAALILDYGPAAAVPANSLRGVRRHARVGPFAAPVGRVDLSADVDFLALVEAAVRASPGVECHGPVDQADFLAAMGLGQRAAALAKTANAANNNDKDGTKGNGNGGAAAAIESAARRLVDRGPDGMGRVYKALAILPENGGRRRPVGFGGDVA